MSTSNVGHEKPTWVSIEPKGRADAYAYVEAAHGIPGVEVEVLEPYDPDHAVVIAAIRNQIESANPPLTAKDIFKESHAKIGRGETGQQPLLAIGARSEADEEKLQDAVLEATAYRQDVYAMHEHFDAKPTKKQVPQNLGQRVVAWAQRVFPADKW